VRIRHISLSLPNSLFFVILETLMRKNIQQLFEEFLFESEFVKMVRPETLRGYSSTFQLFVNLLPETTLDSLTVETIVTFFRILQERKRIVGKGIVKVGIKKSTVATYWGKLSAFFEWLVAKQYLESNPLRSMRYPSVSYEDRKYLKKEEIEKIITAIHTHHNNNLFILKRNLVLFYTCLFCGLRKEELLMLQVRDIDLQRKIITIRAETSKSMRSREIPLHSSLIMYVKDYLAVRKYYTTPFLIASSTKDEKLTTTGLKYTIEKLRNTSGVQFHLHQLRHTFAINFLHSSNNIAKLKQLLGHRSLSMTLIYLRCLPTKEMKKDIECLSIDKMI
jgi:integrase/recombinase XerD